MACARFLVSGLVQGVYYRASARAEAMRLGVQGYARNLADGRVEVTACGAPDMLKALENWLLVGPPAARVMRVERSELPEQGLQGFRTL